MKAKYDHVQLLEIHNATQWLGDFILFETVVWYQG